MILFSPISFCKRSAGKVFKALSEGGPRLLIRRFFKYVFIKLRSYYLIVFYRPPLHSEVRDILFINGCTLPHPSRYRVDHQLEQLAYFGLSTGSIFRTYLTKRHLYLYRGFIFYRVPANDFLIEFVEEAKAKGKACFFDIDDLMYDFDYVKDIDYVKNLEGVSSTVYRTDVDSMGRMLSACQYGITSTQQLKTAMSERLDDVLVNPNVASTLLDELSHKAYRVAKQSCDARSEVRIGYLSGSVTHNPDLALIENALFNIAKNNPAVRIVLVGMVTASKKLASLGSQLELEEFVEWKKLPGILANLDINVAPLEDTIFNRAKSENKWMEAALVKVPTVASSVGRLKDIIKHNEDGFLCADGDEWMNVLQDLVDNRALRESTAEQAYQRVQSSYTTQRSGALLAEFICSKLKPFVVFVVPTLNLSGGMRVILQHAKLLKEQGADVLIYVDSDDPIQEMEFDGHLLSVVGTREVSFKAHAHTMIATLWTTVDRVISQSRVSRKVYLVQNYEVDFYEAAGISQKQAASATYLMGKDIEYLTISKWCQNWLKDIYDVDAKYLPNGIDREKFSPVRASSIDFENEIHVLVEGNSDDEYKNVDESMQIVSLLKQRYGKKIVCHYLAYRAQPKDNYEVDHIHFQIPFDEVGKIYSQCSLLIKSSSVESFSYPPLEMMATGGLVIVGRNGGNQEYAIHEENCMVYSIGDLDEALDNFDAVMGSPRLRLKLVEGGKQTASDRDWRHVNQAISSYWLP